MTGFIHQKNLFRDCKGGNMRNILEWGGVPGGCPVPVTDGMGCTGL